MLRFARSILLGVASVLTAAISLQAQTRALLVLNKEGTVAIVDPANGNVLGRAPTGSGPHEIVSSGRLAVVSNYGSGRTLSVIDVPSRKEIHRVDVSPLSRPHGLFASAGKVYFTAEGSGKIGRYDPSTNRVDWSAATNQDGTHMVIVSPDGKRLYTTNIGSDTVSILEMPANGGEWKATAVRVGSAPEGFDLSPDGKQLWAANSGDKTVSIVDVDLKKVIGSIDVGTRRSNRLKFTPDGKRVLISDLSTGDLTVVDAASRRVTRRLKIGSSVAGILVTPESDRAYVAATPDNFVAVVDLAKLEVVNRIATGEGPDGMDWITIQ